MVDFSKPVQTRDGRPVRILCTDRNSIQYPVVGLILCPDRGEELKCWDRDGNHGNGLQCPIDLVQIPQTRKHANVIKAWADGAEVQARMGEHDVWIDMPRPRFEASLEYRVKP